jgi:hypothetical protein
MAKLRTEIVRKRSEADIKRQVVATLRGLGVLCFRMNAGRITSEHNGKKRFINLAPSGTADILAFVGKFPLWIETKREGNVQSREQVQFQRMVRQMGHEYIVARDSHTVAIAVNALRGFEQ